ncbi:MAG: sigma-70 family RNA polymerase sigma factor [Tepidisphaeraceae bacterium]|jgi:RNA polymerase sigma-70 factor (ECF subfamily)
MANPSTLSEATRASLLIRLSDTGPEREVAWAEFHDLYAPIISGFARRMGTPPQDVEDLVQEVLKAFFCVSPEFNYQPGVGRFRGYLKTCVWHKLNQLRRRREPRASGLERFDPDDLAVETVWNDVWETEKLGRALAIVRQRYSINTERQQTFRAFEMCTLLDRPTDQVAAELGLSLESVRAAKSRVSKALRETFDNLDELTG